MVNAPIFEKTKNIFQSEIIFFGQICAFGAFSHNFSTKIAIFFKKKSKKFGGLKIMLTFATRLRKNGLTSSLKRLITVQEASTEKKQFIEKR